MRRSVQKSAPPGQSGLWAEISSAVASQTIRLGPNHHESPKSRAGSRNYVAASRSKLDGKRRILRRGQGTLPRYQASGVLQLNPQPSVAISQSFRRLLEF